MSTQKTPPAEEESRQKVLHFLRTKRVDLVKDLKKANWANNAAVSELQTINSQIDMLKYLRRPFPDVDPEPTLDEIYSRSAEWYWDPWDTDDEEED